MVQYYHTFDVKGCETKNDFYYELGKLVETVKDEVDGLFLGMTKDEKIHLELWLTPEQNVKPEFFSKIDELKEMHKVETVASGFISRIPIPKE